MKRRTVALAAVLGAIAGGALVKKVWLEKYRQKKAELATADKEKDLLYTWLLLEQKGAGLEEYFSAHGYRTVAILGLNREGRRLFDTLNQSEEISVVFGTEIDNYAAVHESLTVYRVGDDPLPEADCIVICDLTNISEKSETLRLEFKGEIVTLSEVLAWLIERHQIKPWDGAVRNWPPEEQ